LPSKIFFNEGNYLYLLRRVKEQALQYGAAVIACGRMPNHRHCLLWQETGESWSKFRQVLFNA